MAQLGGYPRDVHAHLACALAGEMPCVKTSKMAANSVQESLLTLPDEPHSLNYFEAINLEARTSACRKVQWAKKKKEMFMPMQTSVVRLQFCSKNGLRGSIFQKFSGGACPQTPLVVACSVHTLLVTRRLQI